MHLKPHSVAEFTPTMDREIILPLRKQQGFRDEITFMAWEGTGGVAISF